MPALFPTGNQNRGPNAAGILGFINALDEGLRGDGNGSDGTALTNLFNALPSAGAVVVLPPGTYNLDSSPSVPNNVTLLICAGVSLTGSGSLSAAAGGAIADLRNGLTVKATSTLGGLANNVQIAGGATGNAPIISAVGSDTNINLAVQSKGTGSVINLQPLGITSLSVAGVASAVNYISVLNAATGTGPAILAQGSDTNISLTLTPTGAGVVNLNYAAVALGGGSAPTLGTIGGSGPATAAQNSWVKIAVQGTATFLPAWR